MYPQRDLARLGAYKAALRQDIHRHRKECASAAIQVTQPLILLDRALALWRRVLPLATLAALPLGILVQRTLFPRLRIIRSLLRWAPVIVTGCRSIHSLVTARPLRAPPTTAKA